MDRIGQLTVEQQRRKEQAGDVDDSEERERKRDFHSNVVVDAAAA